MGDKIESIHGDKMKVGVHDGYEVYEKGYPQSLKDSGDYTKYDWIGNFGFKEISSGREITEDFDNSYEIEVEDRPNKDLVYWDGKKTKKFSDAKVKDVDKGKVRTAKLKMGDPPIGWAR